VKSAAGSTTSTAVPPGKYEREGDDGISAGFEVKSGDATSIVFDLTAVLTSPGEHNGEITDGRANFDAANTHATTHRTYMFTAGSDCSIMLTFSDARDSADVKQDGPCADDAGFGAFVDVTGHYVKK
jgi:hypothetical protein